MNRSVQVKPGRENVSAAAEISVATPSTPGYAIDITLFLKPEYRTIVIDPKGGDRP